MISSLLLQLMMLFSRKNWAGGANFKKGHFFGQKDTLTNANFHVEENFY